jgi:hypothetical protein
MCWIMVNGTEQKRPCLSNQRNKTKQKQNAFRTAGECSFGAADRCFTLGGRISTHFIFSIPRYTFQSLCT